MSKIDVSKETSTDGRRRNSPDWPPLPRRKAGRYAGTKSLKALVKISQHKQERKGQAQSGNKAFVPLLVYAETGKREETPFSLIVTSESTPAALYGLYRVFASVGGGNVAGTDR